ncbi:phosphotransferase family protein [Paractinoplanes toevensis]|uniref:Aminoglycoside phosphotransferase n=1 Tax=Paractinoplanes toevensis TaxID=571911 RepID=A0A919WCV3_9ACTN|nr:phosphotransferase [Actinoplanes toevensis]GIM97914.1 aminoglycoside phosphotransferase [Actinoplanes toevensis]
MREFLGIDDVGELIPGLGAVELTRLAGGTKKGVYRVRLGDDSTVILYRWAAGENYWPSVATVPDDPFTGEAGIAEFAANHAALRNAGVRVPELLRLDHDGAFALVEDAGGESLERLMEKDPAAAAAPLAELGAALRRMHADVTAHYGPLTRPAGPQRPAEDMVVDRALVHLAAVADRDPRLTAARNRIEDHLRGLRETVLPRREYGLVHGELGADHVFVNAAGEPVMIDFEGLIRFDAEWDHAWIEMRFGADYPRLDPAATDPARLALYSYAQVLSLIEGPLRIAGTDFPDRQWMLDLADWNITKALAAL